MEKNLPANAGDGDLELWNLIKFSLALRIYDVLHFIIFLWLAFDIKPETNVLGSIQV